MAMTNQMTIPRAKRIGAGLVQLADPKVWIASTAPIAAATALAYRDTGTIHFGWLLATLAGIYLIEIGKNAVNEVVDYQSGVDLLVAEEDITPFNAGKKTITQGLLSVGCVKAVAWVTLILGAAVGFAIVWHREPRVLWIGLAGLFAAVAYSLPPFKLAYRGLGELTVGLAFGPLLMQGAYLVQAGRFSLEAGLIGLVLGLLIANVLWINEFPDYYADKRAGKMTGVVRLGKERAVAVYGAIYALAYAALALAAVWLHQAVWFVGFVSAPKAIESVIVARKHYDDTPRLVRANAMTVEVYGLTGLALAIAALVHRGMM